MSLDSLTVEYLRRNLTVHEGDKLRVYDDATGLPIVKGTVVKGNPTIGRGRNLADPGISQDEDDYMFTSDLTRVQRELDVTMPWWGSLNPARQLALAELAFNIGTVKLRLSWPRTMTFLATGQYNSAANEIMSDKVWVDEVGLARATYIAGLVRTGVLA